MIHQLLLLLALTSPVKPCDAPAFHALDFWIGSWDVYSVDGKKYATQKVKPVADGCGITAEWTGPEGDVGLALFGYDPVLKGWRAVYLSNQTPRQAPIFIRYSDSEYKGSGVRFTRDVTARGPQERERMTISPVPGGRVRQHLEVSHDGGATWSTVFNAEHRAAAH